MKKLYSLVALAVMSVGVNAQIFNATFSDVTGTGGNDGLFSGSGFFIDDIKVAEGVLAVSEVKNTKINLVRNTVVENHIIFGFSGNASLINQNGQMVKTAKVTENEKLQVSDIASGIYIISANVDGKAVSQKIIKK